MWSSNPRPAKSDAINEMPTVVGDLMSPAESASLEVSSEQRSNTVMDPNVRMTKRYSSGMPILEAARERRDYSQDLVFVLQNPTDLLEMQALKAAALSIRKLDSIVFETPFAALERHDLVDLLQKLCDGEVLRAGTRPDKLDLWESVATDHQPKADVLSLHG